MMLLIIIIVIALVAWALQLMEQAIQGQEFSLMLAGFLVASSAAAMMAVYFLMGNYVVYLEQLSELQQSTPSLYSGTAFAESSESFPSWLFQAE